MTRLTADIDLETRVRPVVDRLIAAGDKVGTSLLAEFEQLRAAGSPDATSRRLGFANESGALSPDGSRWPSAPIKYALDVREHVPKYVPYLRYFTDVRSAFDIGVGPAFLFTLLRDGMGIRMSGVDIELEQRGVYAALRRELSVCDVWEHEVRADVEPPIPRGTEAVVAFWSTFDRGWSRHEHRQFVRMCRRNGVRTIFWRFNSGQPVPEVRQFYRQLGARFPMKEDKRFAIIPISGRLR
jgi:hypothetical protein